MARQPQPKKEAFDPKDSPRYWLSWISDNKKGMPTRHANQTRDAWREYLKVSPDEDNQDDAKLQSDSLITNRVYPAYTTKANVILPALFSRIPQLVTSREFESEDELAEMMDLITLRLGNYLMKNSDFEEAMSGATAEFLHGSKATTQVLYYADTTLNKKRKNLKPGASENEYLGEDGTPHEGEVMQDGQGYFAEEEDYGVDEDTQKITLSSVVFDEVLHTKNAKSQCDVETMAYYFCYSRQEAESKFDEDVLKDYGWKSAPAASPLTSNATKKPSTGEEYVDGWEIYHKPTKMVYWVSEGAKQFLKKPAKDPYGFENFFPSPDFIIAGKPPKSLYPTPIWIHLRPVAEQLNILYTRLFGLIDAARVRALIDPELSKLANADDQQYIELTTTANIINKGGIANMIFYLPLAEVSDAIEKVNAQESVFDDKMNQWFGTPDVVQGISDPIETLGAQEIKAQSSYDRFRNIKKKVQELARDSIEMMLDLAYKVFSDEKIARVTGFEFMSEERKQMFKPALDKLRNDDARNIRIDIDTDSLTFVDQGLKTQKINAATVTVTQGLQQAADMIKNGEPELAMVALQAINLSLEQNDLSRTFVDPVSQTIKGLIKKAEEAAQQPPPPPPPPDPAILKIEWEKEKFAQELPLRQMEAQQNHEYRMAVLANNQNKTIGDQNLKAQAIQVDVNKTAGDQSLESQKIQVDAMNAQADNQVAREKNLIDAGGQQAQAVLEADSLELSKQIAKSEEAFNAIKIQLQKERDKFDAINQLRDNIRLEKNDNIGHIKDVVSLHHDAAALREKAVPKITSAPTINIKLPESNRPKPKE